MLNPSCPSPGRREKVDLNFYFHTSLWCLRVRLKGSWFVIYDEVLNFHDWILCYHEPFQDKIKSLELSMDMWILKVILTPWTLTILIACLFLELILSILFIIEPTNLKKNLILEFPKNMMKRPLIWIMYFTLQVIYVAFNEIKWLCACVPLLNVIHKNL